MPVRATLRSSLRVPELGTSLHSAGAAPRRFPLQAVLRKSDPSSCSPSAFFLLGLLVLSLLVLFVLKRITTIKDVL